MSEQNPLQKHLAENAQLSANLEQQLITPEQGPMFPDSALGLVAVGAARRAEGITEAESKRLYDGQAVAHIGPLMAGKGEAGVQAAKDEVYKEYVERSGNAHTARKVAGDLEEISKFGSGLGQWAHGFELESVEPAKPNSTGPQRAQVLRLSPDASGALNFTLTSREIGKDGTRTDTHSEEYRITNGGEILSIYRDEEGKVTSQRPMEGAFPEMLRRFKLEKEDPELFKPGDTKWMNEGESLEETISGLSRQLSSIKASDHNAVKYHYAKEDADKPHGEKAVESVTVGENITLTPLTADQPRNADEFERFGYDIERAVREAEESQAVAAAK